MSLQNGFQLVTLLENTWPKKWKKINGKVMNAYLIVFVSIITLGFSFLILFKIRFLLPLWDLRRCLQTVPKIYIIKKVHFRHVFLFNLWRLKMIQPDLKMGLKVVVVQCQKGDCETVFFKRTFDGMKSESMLMTVTIIIKKSKAYVFWECIWNIHRYVGYL